MKKIVGVVFVAVVLGLIALTLTGCSTFKSFTYKVETGDKIEVKMETTGGYNLTSELPIKFSKDDEVLAEGEFRTSSAYDDCVKMVTNSDYVGVVEEIETKSNKTCDYVFYKYLKNIYVADDYGYQYVLKIKDSNTCFMLTCTSDEDTAREVFDKLTFSVEK